MKVIISKYPPLVGMRVPSAAAVVLSEAWARAADGASRDLKLEAAVLSVAMLLANPAHGPGEVADNTAEAKEALDAFIAAMRRANGCKR